MQTCFNVNHFNRTETQDKINLINHAPGLVLLVLVLVVPNTLVIYPVIVIAFLVSALLVFFPVYTNARLCIAATSLTLKTKSGKIHIDAANISKINFKAYELKSTHKYVQCTITLKQGDPVHFYINRLLLKGKISRATEIIKALQHYSAFAEKVQ
ncbi:MAG TPA: hypothetical protein VD996_11770 [Chitinophagaceae bacterium]|nr:hypothetical protein [Chitinophagaceae bacterium]